MDRGALLALASALLFGAGAPLAKLLLGSTSPWLLAGLLYTASGIALFLYRRAHRAPGVRSSRSDLPFLLGAVGFGGAIGPVLLLWGLQHMPASGASLLLNGEGIFTALIAWLVFRESTSRRIIAGFLSIATGALVLSWPGQASFAGVGPCVAVLAACLCWAVDNNLTGRIALTDATWLAMVKGLVAGPVNLALALWLGAQLPSPPVLLGGAAVGVLAYGVSLVLYILGMRHLGTARAGAYFSVAPFFGALLAVATGDPVTPSLVVASVLMGFGIWLHLTERHSHEHTHEQLAHAHEHSHDDGHHDHVHHPAVAPGTSHSHPHVHEPVTHTHPHFPDAHHRHDHEASVSS